MSTGVSFILEQDGQKSRGPYPPCLESGGPSVKFDMRNIWAFLWEQKLQKCEKKVEKNGLGFFNMNRYEMDKCSSFLS